MPAIYDQIGKTYALGRRTDPRIADQIWARLPAEGSILNIGAGAGSYEPSELPLISLEPSMEMIRQRPRSSAPVVQGVAERLPFADDAFSHCLTVLSIHHWVDRKSAFAEIRRVAREGFVAVTWDPESEPFWLTRDYFPEILDTDVHIFPRMKELKQTFGEVDVAALEIPADCIDGFLAAFWRRPEAYLNPTVRANISSFSKIVDTRPVLARLRHDLETGVWKTRNRDLLDRDTMDLGYRLVVARL